jgi:type III secretion system-like peptide-binding chaperone
MRIASLPLRHRSRHQAACSTAVPVSREVSVHRRAWCAFTEGPKATEMIDERTDLLGRSPTRDDDGDYVLPIDDVHVVVAPRAAMDGQIVVRVFSICNVGVNVTPDLGLFLARLNFGLMFGRFALDAEHRSIWFDETLLGEEFRDDELRFTIRLVASTADSWDDRFKQMFGGATHQEVLAGLASEPRPPIKPGQGSGQYL